MKKTPEIPLIKARVLVAGTHGNCNDVIEIDAELAATLVGTVDADPAAVAYAESLTTGGSEGGPTLADLLVVRDALLRREHEMGNQFEQVRERAAANQVEACRLEQLAADHATEGDRLTCLAEQLADDRAAFEAAKLAVPALTTGKGKDKAAA